MKDALAKLSAAGHVAYIVGGSVRDFLLGRAVKDHDIATSASPDELEALFPDAIAVGKAFGVLKIPLRTPGAPEFMEIATFREDLEYRDHRHPVAVRFAGASEDSRRRDFTVNALYFDPASHKILDWVGGLEDLKSKTLRAIGLPGDRFKEDALRLLRAVRFATSLGFEIEPDTARAIELRASLITKISVERIRDELTRMLQGPGPARAIELFDKFGLRAMTLPEITLMRKSPGAWKQTLAVLDRLRRNEKYLTVELAWAALLHQIEDLEVVRKAAERMRLSSDEVDTIVAILSDLPKPREAFRMREATLRRLVREPHFDEVLRLHRAVAMAGDGNLAHYEFCHGLYGEWEKLRAEGGEHKLLTGADLVQLGLSPGPRFTEILRAVEDQVLEKKIQTKEQALEYVVGKFVR